MSFGGVIIYFSNGYFFDITSPRMSNENYRRNHVFRSTYGYYPMVAVY